MHKINCLNLLLHFPLMRIIKFFKDCVGLPKFQKMGCCQKVHYRIGFTLIPHNSFLFKLQSNKFKTGEHPLPNTRIFRTRTSILFLVIKQGWSNSTDFVKKVCFSKNLVKANLYKQIWQLHSFFFHFEDVLHGQKLHSFSNYLID